MEIKTMFNTHQDVVTFFGKKLMKVKIIGCQIFIGDCNIAIESIGERDYYFASKPDFNKTLNVIYLVSRGTFSVGESFYAHEKDVFADEEDAIDFIKNF